MSPKKIITAFVVHIASVCCYITAEVILLTLDDPSKINWGFWLVCGLVACGGMVLAFVSGALFIGGGGGSREITIILVGLSLLSVGMSAGLLYISHTSGMPVLAAGLGAITALTSFFLAWAAGHEAIA